MAGENLSKIDHIVVLMMENRSFDHMLGYLSLRGGRTDIDGLAEGMHNVVDGRRYDIRRLETTAIQLDPCHSGACVAQQIANGNGGFASSYAAAGGDPRLVMGYYDARSVPVFDLLAREYLVCDRWFSSVPGATWPNRLYALAGQAPSLDNRVPPLYYLPSFVRHLDRHGRSWRWYVHEKILFGPLATIELVDGDYPSIRHLAFFDPQFFADARSGELPAVSWIDPNFSDFGGLKGANDDHPPVDITAGQGLVQTVVQALGNGPKWERTLLVVTYDEHGGFYDHVHPDPAPGPAPFNRYGVRVPAFVVSPWVARGAADRTLFDHTSIINTILLRFCRDANGGIPDMGPRVAAANHLGALLANQEPRRPLANDHFQPAIAAVSRWVEVEHLERVNIAMSLAPPKRNDFQAGWELAAAHITEKRARKLQEKPRKPKKPRKPARRKRAKHR